MKYLLLLYCILSGGRTSAQTAVLDKTSRYLKAFCGTTEIYQYRLPDTRPVQLLMRVYFQHTFIRHPDTLFPMAQSMADMIMDYAIFDSATMIPVVEVGWKLSNKDTVMMSAIATPEMLRQYVQKREYYTLAQKMAMLKFGSFLGCDTFFMDHDTLVWGKGVGEDLSPHIDTLDTDIDLIGPLAAEYLLRGTKNLYLAIEVFDKVRVVSFLFTPQGRVRRRVIGKPLDLASGRRQNGDPTMIVAKTRKE